VRVLVIAALGAATSLLVGCPASPASDGPNITQPATDPPAAVDERIIRNVKVYVGGDGMRVSVVRFMPPNENEALIEITGTESEIDSIVLAHQLVDRHFETKVHGREYWTMRGTDEDGVWDIWVGEREREVVYDEAASATADGEAVRKRHHEQAAAGVIEAIERFNREERIAEGDALFASELARIPKECDFSIPGAIAWDTVDEAMMLKYSVYGYCSHPISALRVICERDPSFRDVLRERVKKFHCQFGDEVNLELDDAGLLTWTTYGGTSNLSTRASKDIMRAITDDPTVLATGRGHYMLVDPLSIYASVDDPKMYFGDDKVVHALRYAPRQHGFYRGEFWSPREDHAVSVMLSDGAWKLTCGDRSQPLTELTGTKRSDFLSKIERKPSTWKYEPYLLARDDRGIYYYVDRLRDGGKGFRVFRGPKGGLKITRLTNIVEDALGEIFATKVGSLRLVIEAKDEKAAWWLKDDDKTDLVTVPIRMSQTLIYSQLGVYDGQDLGTPCDHY
jgi:hypothetical protein